MYPALPDGPGDGSADHSGDAVWASADDPATVRGGEVGAFRQGSAASQWALARYLVGRAIGESVGITLLVVVAVLVLLAVLVQFTVHATFVVVVLVVAALLALLLRAALLAVLRRLTSAQRFGPVEDRLRELVSATRSDVLRELRRIGLPSHVITLPLLGVRMVGRRRVQTLARLRDFQVERAVPAARVDELHLLLRDMGRL